MISAKALLAHLIRPEIAEVCFVSGKRPAARAGDALTEIEPLPWSTDDILQFLFSVGGSRYLDDLGPKPIQWRSRVEAVGGVSVTATMRGEVLEVRIALTDRPAAATPPAGTSTPTPAVAPPATTILEAPAPAPAPPAPGLRPSTVAELFEAAFALTRLHLGAFFWTAGLVLIPTMMLSTAAGTLTTGGLREASWVVTSVVLMLIEAPLTLACARALGMIREPRTLEPSALYFATSNRLGAVVAVILLGQIAPIPFSCAFVGLFLFLRFSVALPTMLVEGTGPVVALRRSYALTGRAIVESIVVLLAGAAAVVSLELFAGIVTSVGVSLLAAGVSRASSSPAVAQAILMMARVGYSALSAGLLSVALPFLAALSVVLYRETRVREALALAAAPARDDGGVGAEPYRSAPSRSAEATGAPPGLDPIAPWPFESAVAASQEVPSLGLASMAPGWLHFVARLARRLGADLDGSGSRRRIDGVFIAFVAAVGALFVYAGAAPARFERALGRASLCVAQANAECAREALEAARPGGERDVRFRIVEADAALLAGEQRQAQALLETMDPAREEYTFRGERKSMSPEVRAYLLLLRGDLAIARGRLDEALPELSAARLLVADPELSDARLARVQAARKSVSDGTASGKAQQIAELRVDVDRLIELASRDDRETVQLRASDLQQRVSQLTSVEARSKLGLVIQATRNVSRDPSWKLKSTPQRGWSRPAPTPPSRDSFSPGAPTWQLENAERRYQERLAQYERSLAAYREEQTAEDTRRYDKWVEGDQEMKAKIAEARRLADEAFAILERGL